MPEQDGFETCRQIRAVAQTDQIPIIFLTGISALSEKVQALRSGGDDYITKPFEPTGELAGSGVNAAHSSAIDRCGTKPSATR